jgi:hypothetical protein
MRLAMLVLVCCGGNSPPPKKPCDSQPCANDVTAKVKACETPGCSVEKAPVVAKTCESQPCVNDEVAKGCDTPGCSAGAVPEVVVKGERCGAPPCDAAIAEDKTCPDGPPCDVGFVMSASSMPSASEIYAPRAPSDCEGPGCNRLADKYLTGNGAPRSVAIALELYERACNTGAPSGCFYAGRLIERGVGATPDVTRAQQLYARACKAGNAVACKHCSPGIDCRH